MQAQGHGARPDHRPRDRRALRRHAGDASTMRSTTLSASASFRPSTRSRTNTGSSWRSIPSCSASLESLSTHLPAVLVLDDQRPGAALRASSMSSSAPGPLLITPSRPVSGDHDLLQSRARRLRSARPSPRSTRREADIGLPPSFVISLAGRGRGLPSLADERTLPASSRRWSRCISCSACSTRASSIRSRSSRRCPRRASARCSR